VSVEDSEDKYEGNKKIIKITVFFGNASAKCCAPNVPIRFSSSSSVINVCAEKYKDK
jgi:hypothetical protein